MTRFRRGAARAVLALTLLLALIVAALAPSGGILAMFVLGTGVVWALLTYPTTLTTEEVER